MSVTSEPTSYAEIPANVPLTMDEKIQVLQQVMPVAPSAPTKRGHTGKFFGSH